MSLQNLSIKLRLVLLVLLALVLMAVVGAYGLTGMSNTEKSLNDIYTNRLEPSGHLAQIMQTMQEARVNILLSLQHDPSSEFARLHDHPIELHLDSIKNNLNTVTKAWEGFMRSELSAAEERLAKDFAAKRQSYVQKLNQTVELIRQGKYFQANEAILFQLIPESRFLIETLDALLNTQFSVAQQMQVAADEDFNSTRNLVLLLIFIALVAVSGMAWLIIAGINQGVEQLESASQAMAKGDLTARANYKGRDELGHIATAFNGMGASFQNMVAQLAKATSQMAAAAEETSAVTLQASRGVQQQQAETDQVATAMNEMTATVQEVANSAASAADAANNADEQADKGNQVVGATIEAINKLAADVENAAEVIHQLEEQSDNIGTVLDVIRGIAEQTNLLALNAAIEAARAGEQGRGFAVVADEVRSLASRTQESTAEIQSMIEKLQQGAANAVKVMQASREQAQTGVEQVGLAGDALDSISQAVSQINDLNAQIASAAEEQSAVAEEINRNLVNISEVAIQTNEGADQIAIASSELSQLAIQLQGLVNKFKI